VPGVTILRDSTLTLALVALWSLEARGVRIGPDWVVPILTGVFTALVGFLLHEWAHLAGALATGSKVHYPNRVLAPLLFHFDTEENDRAQFLAMSYGGYVGSALGMIAILLFVPLGTLAGQTALGLAALGGIVTAVAEVPTTIRVFRGGSLPTGYAFVPPR
jgi:hypothetical protein